MKQKILITGGSGLLALNWAHAVSNRCSVTLGIHNRQLFIQQTHVEQLDLESIDNIIVSIYKLSPQVVIHAAGLAHVDKCEANPDLAYHVNVILAANVARACAVTGVKLVHISTDHLFSGQEAFIDEERPVAPINVYGRTKAEAERQVLEANPEALVIRTNFFGWGTSYRQSFSDIVINTLKSRSELVLFQDVFYSPILVETLAVAVHDLIDMSASGVFNVVGDERISKYDFGVRVAEEFSLGVNYIKKGMILDKKTLVQRPHDMSLSNRKVCNLLGRGLDGTKQHLERLHLQENNGFARMMKIL